MLGILLSQKNGKSFFTMADVNILFPSPMKPQTVLLFRTVISMGAILLCSLYLFIYTPEIMLAGVTGWAIPLIFAAFFICLCYLQIVSILFYTLCMTYPKIKKLPDTLACVILGAITADFLLRWKSPSLSFGESLVAMLTNPAGRRIPVWGWMRGFIMNFLEGKPLHGTLDLVLLLAFLGVLIFAIWHVKADFYEDAVTNAEALKIKTDALLEGRANRAKDRTRKLKRDGAAEFGTGAAVFFRKPLYNRFRFGLFHVFSPLMSTMLLCAAFAAALTVFAAGSTLFLPTGLLLTFIVMMATIGDPLAEENSKNFMFLVPESPFIKLFWAISGGLVCRALDLVPALVVSGILLRANPLVLLAWFLVLLSLSAWCNCSGLLLQLLLPDSLNQNLIKSFQMMLLFSGALPTFVLILIGCLWKWFYLFAGIAFVVNVSSAAVCYVISAALSNVGRR